MVEAGRDLGTSRVWRRAAASSMAERQPVEPAHDLCDHVRSAGAGAKPGATPRRPEPRTARRPRRRRGSVGSGGSRTTLLAGHPQPLAARRAIDTAGHAAEHSLDQVGHRLQDVLAVVEEQHELDVGQHGGDALGQADARATSIINAAATTSIAAVSPAVASSAMTTGRLASRRDAAGGRPR